MYVRIKLTMPRTSKRTRTVSKKRADVYSREDSTKEPKREIPSPRQLSTSRVDQIPVAVPLATRSPSLDLTVTYDYTANFQGSPCQDNTASRRSEQFVALFPFAESPSVSHKSVVGGSALWRDLSLQQTSLPNKIPKTPPSHGIDFLHLNVIAHKLRETLNEHQAESKRSLTYDPNHSHTSCLDITQGETECVSTVSECDTEEWEASMDQDHLFWSQAAAATCDIESTPDDHLGSGCDNEFIDQLLTQGVDLETTKVCDHDNLLRRQMCSQDEIDRKRESAKEKLRANRLL